MFRSGSDLSSGDRLIADLCIVGAGPAGLALAREFLGSGARVIVLESGERSYTKSLRAPLRVLRQHTRGAQSLSAGSRRGQPYTPLRFSRARAFGGSTNALLGHGLQTRPFDPIDFESRPDLALSGWPIDRSSLDPYYARAQILCGLSAEPFDREYWQSQVDAPSLAVDPRQIESTYYRFAPVGQFAGYARDFEGSAGVEVITDATVTGLVASRAGDRLAGVEAASLDGTRFQVDASTFVLAGGALENARLLLAGDGTRGARSLGNEYDMVGRCFMEHPEIAIGFWTPSDDALEALPTFERTEIADQLVMKQLRLPDEVLRAEGLLNGTFELAPGRPTMARPGVVAARLLRRSIDHKNRVHGVTRAIGDSLRHLPDVIAHVRARGSVPDRPVVAVEVMAEQEPNPDSRVRLSNRTDRFGLPRVELDWQLTGRDIDSVRRSASLLGSALAGSGLGRLDVTIPANDSAIPVFGNWHHMGTTRMDADPARGVVDADCRVHGVANLYVAGSSVFPTGGCSNPTLTLVALALRLADHLRARPEAVAGSVASE